MKIITAHDYSKDEGADGSVIGRIRKMQAEHRARGVIVQINDVVSGEPVYAEIYQGSWIARCECGGTEFVSPNEPIFFCWTCANRNNNSHLREVVFPRERAQIEEAILERKVNDLRGLSDKDRAYMATVIDGGLPRCWLLSETLDDILEQNKTIKKAGK